ncbi:MAG: thiolase family protein [Phycisphaerae bacterium]|nr:thiolase family protein [Phycisphaerae bacterium]
MAGKHSYIVAAKRSPIGNFLSGLSKLTAPQIGAQVAKATIAESGVDPAAINEVYIGQVLQAGVGQNPARQVALAAGIPDKISCTTINKVCGSSLQSVMFADQTIRSGDADVVLCGGIESMSQAPFYVKGMRTGHKFGDAQLIDGMQFDGLTNIFDMQIMGILGDYTGKKAGVTRQQCDEFAYRSHKRADAASQSGAFDKARVPIEIPKAAEKFNKDETIRADISVEKLAALKPVFGADGLLTAGNSSALSDGASTLLAVSEAGLKRCSAKPMARIVGQFTSGGPPKELFFAPIEACRKACEKAGWNVQDVDLWEMNEAFSTQMLACMQALELNPDKVNVHGGAIALGHPIGASGCRILTQLAHALHTLNKKRGVASLCLGGGNAVAVAIEAV